MHIECTRSQHSKDIATTGGGSLKDPVGFVGGHKFPCLEGAAFLDSF
jgi:hypothetical protein